MKEKGILLDANYLYGEKSVIQLCFKTKKGKIVLKDPEFKPYLYFVPSINAEQAKKSLEKEKKILKIEIVKKKRWINRKPEKILKIFFDSTKVLAEQRSFLESLEFCSELREQDIPFHKRYLLDKCLEPTKGYEIEFEKDCLKKLMALNQKQEQALKKKLTIVAFDLETLSSTGFSNPEKDAIAMIGFSENKDRVVSYKKIKSVELVENEKCLLKKTKKILRKADIIATYNGDNFDFPFLSVRAKKLGVKLEIGVDESEPKTERKGMENSVYVFGSPHIDVYKVVRTMARFGAIDLIKYDLESVVETIFSEKKEKVTATEINKAWKTGKNLERVAEYNREDAVATKKICLLYLALFEQLSRLVKYTLFDSTRASSGQLVEALIFEKSFQKNILLPRKPSQSEVNTRILQSYEGGYVKEPKPGLHENIAVLDFTSLHPTIMISHNISPETVDCNHKECRKKNMAPSKNHFCIKKPGFLSSILKELFFERKKWKQKLKTLDKTSLEYAQVNARQQALKILLNSFYGALGYARFRWYSRESARAVTAWSREYVKMVSEMAEKEGFESLYSDTDSAFLKIPKNKSREDIKIFLKKVNKALPKVMNLELQGFYKRGIFVTKKSEQRAAKKRYALIDYNGNLKIVGFEYVRRDWAGIAKKTQKKVIKAILMEGNPGKAVEIVKKTILDLRNNKISNNDLVVYTQIRQNIEKYESIGPHIAAAKKAIQKGKRFGEGSIIGYIITRTGKSISDKAELAEFVKKGNYDPEYYIRHQIIPATINIIKEFGYSETDLIVGGKQTGLKTWQ